MKRILLDTNAYAAFKRNDPFALEVLKRAEFVGMDAVVVAELLCGFKGGNKERRNIDELSQFLDSPRVNVLNIDEETAEVYSKVYWDLKKKGRPIPTNDIWVAASAIRHGLALFTFDEHFKSIDGLLLKSTVY